MPRTVVAALSLVAALTFSGLVPDASAQTEAAAAPVGTDSILLASAQLGTSDPRGVASAGVFGQRAPTPIVLPAPEAAPPRRSSFTPVLVGLHALTAVTQAMDLHSTMQALDRGAVEANPIMSGVVKNRAAFIGVKAAVGAGLVLATHRLGQRNKVAAIALSAAVNSAYLYVAHHNYKVARGLR
ncbi:MAG: DUF5658 family protein [Acidobacteriota bacterium]